MKITLNPTGIAPTLGSPGAAAYDLYLDLGGKDRTIQIRPGAIEMCHAGFQMSLEKGKVALLLPRSGLGRNGLVLANGTGVIDSDYRGDVIMAFKNNGVQAFNLKHGDRVAQMMITNAFTPVIEVVDSLDSTERGAGGFGSTGS